jgi:hypothetical protein
LNLFPFIETKQQYSLIIQSYAFLHREHSFFYGNDTAVDPNAPEGGNSYQPKAAPWGREL